MANKRDEVLIKLASLLTEENERILMANQADLDAVNTDDMSLVDRLKVNKSKIAQMAHSLMFTSTMENPDKKVLYELIREDGLKIKNVTVPFGTILIIYESRPDVTIEAAAMAFKSGNRIMLKGGREARETNLVLVNLWHKALAETGWDTDWVTYLDLDRAATQRLIADPKSKIDLIIPRGGEGLINFVRSHSQAPIIISGRGNNFVYIDETAAVDMAIDIILNGKSRLSVCNATDKILVHKSLCNTSFLETLVDQLKIKGIDTYINSELKEALPHVTVIEGEEILYQEFLSSKIYIVKVYDIQDAVKHINTYSGGHSASIVSKDISKAAYFMDHVDCAAVYHNASTRFTDGGEVGFGGEMAISTQKLHFRGPVGVGQLVTNKWYIYGEGHIRI